MPPAAIGPALVIASLVMPRPSSAQVSPPGDAPPTARAQLDLRWDSPPGCPGGDEVLHRIRALAGSSLDETDGLSAQGTITRVDGRFRLTLLVPDGVEVRQRVIESDACAELAGAAAVTLALLLGIELGEFEQPADESRAVPPTQSAAAGEPRIDANDEERPVDRDRRTQRDERWAALLRAPAFAADVGPLPRPSLGVGLGAGARHGPWRILFTGTLWASQSVAAPVPDESVGADVQRLAGRFVACRGWRSGRFELAPCMGLSLEYAAARGFGENVSPHASRAAWPAPSAGVVASAYASKSLAFFVGADGYLELARPRIAIDGIGELAQLEPAAVGATVGLEWIFQRVAGGETTAIVKDDGRALPTSRHDHLGVGSTHTPHQLK